IDAPRLEHSKFVWFRCRKCIGLWTDSLIDPTQDTSKLNGDGRVRRGQACIDESCAPFADCRDELLLLRDERVDLGGLAVEVVGDGCLERFSRQLYFDLADEVPTRSWHLRPE